METLNYMETKIIDVYPFDKKHDVKVFHSGITRTDINSKLSKYIEEKWALKKGWKNSWIPLVTMIEYLPDNRGIKITAQAFTYAQTHGCLEAIKNKEVFAPKVDGVPAINNLSIGLIPRIVDPATGEVFILISQRDKGLSHAPGVWNFRGGYMTSLLFDRDNCDKPEYARDNRLYNIRTQADLRIRKQEFEDTGRDVEFAPNPSSLAFGFYHSLEMELGWVATFRKSREWILEHASEHEVVKGQKEHSKELFIPAKDLERLLLNQGDLLNVDPINYEPDDPTKIILLDCNVGELVGGAFEEITGRKLDPSVVKHLRKKGLDIRVMDTPLGSSFTFPSKF